MIIEGTEREDRELFLRTSNETGQDSPLFLRVRYSCSRTKGSISERINKVDNATTTLPPVTVVISADSGNSLNPQTISDCSFLNVDIFWFLRSSNDSKRSIFGLWTFEGGGRHLTSFWGLGKRRFSTFPLIL